MLRSNFGFIPCLLAKGPPSSKIAASNTKLHFYQGHVNMGMYYGRAYVPASEYTALWGSSEHITYTPQLQVIEVGLLARVPPGGQQHGEALTSIGHKACSRAIRSAEQSNPIS
jgi:hypothetical protein